MEGISGETNFEFGEFVRAPPPFPPDFNVDAIFLVVFVRLLFAGSHIDSANIEMGGMGVVGKIIFLLIPSIYGFIFDS